MDEILGYSKIISVRLSVSEIVRVSFETRELDFVNTTVTLLVNATHSAWRLIKIPLVGLSIWGYHEQIKRI
jgi:phosphatidylinositol kinase/protein kinase (PI-3  family)